VGPIAVQWISEQTKLEILTVIETSQQQGVSARRSCLILAIEHRRVVRWQPGVDVRGRDEIGAQEMGNLFGVDAVVLVFAAVDGFEVEGMGQDEGQARGLAGIGQPVPAEHAFAADGQVMLVGLDELEEELEVVVPDVGVDQLLALAIHEADAHLLGVQVESAVELGGGSVAFHNVRRKVP
jgi:hypothetical protein